MSAKISKSIFGRTSAGEDVFLFSLKNTYGAVAEITNYGGRIVRISVPDKNGALTSVVKGYSTLEGYNMDTEYLGAVCGRFANRIAGGQFYIDGKEYSLKKNNGENSLHGGPGGFHRCVWDYEINGDNLVLKYKAVDGEEGFPGNFDVKVTYSWTDECELKLDIDAKTDKKTPVNITNHSYFNLDGEGDILNHMVKINAHKYIPIFSDAIPTGEISLVKDTPFDFTEYKKVGRDIGEMFDQLINGNGYDHCFVLDKKEFGEMVEAVDAFSENSGIGLKVFTSLPGIQFYSGNYLNSKLPGHEGYLYEKRQAFCFEPEFFPDSPNQNGFPCCLLAPGESFKHKIIFGFYVK